jgi:hypothetical protein
LISLKQIEMADVYDIITVPTYDLNTLAVVDNSSYDGVAPTVTLTIEVPGFATVTGLAFNTSLLNVYSSINLLGSTAQEPLPDGVYCISYMKQGETDASVEKRIMRVEKLQEKFDEAFLYLDMMECDRAIKTQSKVDLMSIYFFIQASIASANNCAVAQATKLYIQADKMLNAFIAGRYTTGNNYVINFS